MLLLLLALSLAHGPCSPKTFYCLPRDPRVVLPFVERRRSDDDSELPSEERARLLPSRRVVGRNSVTWILLARRAENQSQKIKRAERSFARNDTTLVRRPDVKLGEYRLVDNGDFRLPAYTLNIPCGSNYYSLR
jgi:hypothetical protein